MKIKSPFTWKDVRLSIPHLFLIALFFAALAWRVYLPQENALTFISMVALLAIEWFTYPFVAAATARKLFSKTQNEPALKVFDKNYPSHLAIFTSLMFLYGITTLVIMLLFGDSWVTYFDYREAHLADKFDFIAEGTLAVGLLLLLAHELPPLLFPLGIVALFWPDSSHVFAVTWASLLAMILVFYPGVRLSLWLPRAAVFTENARASFLWSWREGGKRWGELAIAFFDSIGYSVMLYTTVGILIWAGGTTIRYTLGRWPLNIPLTIGMLVLLLGVPALSNVHFLKRRITILERSAQGGAPSGMRSAFGLLVRVVILLLLPFMIPLFGFLTERPLRLIAAVTVLVAWKLVPWLLRVYEGKDAERT